MRRMSTAATAFPGSSPRSVSLRVSLTAVALAVVVLVSACGRKDRGAGAGADGLDAGMSEDGGGVGGSSLDRARRGLSPQEDGLLKDIRFDYDSYALNPEARGILEQNAAWLKANERATVEIEGHTDERGTIEYNLALGAKRAKAARDYLATMGIEAGRMSTISYGEELPVCREGSEACWLRNRRVHFVVLTP
jgi:peptidoglycan-associated lipoprotein